MKRLIKLFNFSFTNSRLKKIALGGNIQESDVDYVYGEDKIRLILINEEKALHDMTKDWDGEYFHEKNSGDVIGFIQYDVYEDSDGADIFVHYLETRNEYRETRAVKFLLEEFQNQVLNKCIDKYGKENVTISADVVNEKLISFLNRWTQKIGLNFSHYDPLDGMGESTTSETPETSEQFTATKQICQALKHAGAQMHDSSDNCVTVKNFSLEVYVEIVEKYLNNSITELYGYVDMSNGDIIISYDLDNFNKSNSSKEIFYDYINHVASLEGNFDDYIDADRDFVYDFTDNLDKVFPPLTTIKLNNETFEILEFQHELLELDF